MLHSVGRSQIADRLLRTYRGDADLVVFVENHATPSLTPPFAIMNVAECHGYRGPVIATDLHTASLLLGCPGPSRRILYAWDLEWLRLGPFPHDDLRAIYAHPGLEVVARGVEHALAIERAWGKSPVGIVEDADATELIGVALGQGKDRG